MDDIAPRLDTATKEEHDRILEEHLLEVSVRELNVAVENHFLPLMMIPEAVDYSVNHQSRYSSTSLRVPPAQWLTYAKAICSRVLEFGLAKPFSAQ